MARKKMNLSMWFALGVGALYVWTRYRKQNTVALQSPGPNQAMQRVQAVIGS